MRQDFVIDANVDVVGQFARAGSLPIERSEKRKRKSPRITLRLSEDELARLKSAASGISISAYVRKCVFGKEVKTRKVSSRVPVKDEKALAEVLARLGASKMANNLNQLAYQANCGSLLMDDQTEDEIKTACAQIAWMRVKLIEALGLKAKGQ